MSVLNLSDRSMSGLKLSEMNEHVRSDLVRLDSAKFELVKLNWVDPEPEL